MGGDPGKSIITLSNYSLVMNFGPVTPDRQTNRQKAMHMSPPCISTGVLKKEVPQPKRKNGSTPTSEKKKEAPQPQRKKQVPCLRHPPPTMINGSPLTHNLWFVALLCGVVDEATL